MSIRAACSSLSVLLFFLSGMLAGCGGGDDSATAQGISTFESPSAAITAAAKPDKPSTGKSGIPTPTSIDIFAGDLAQAGYLDGKKTSARFRIGAGIAYDKSGNLYVADSYNNVIRKITSTGIVTTLAGTPSTPDYSCSCPVDGTGAAAKFNLPLGITVGPDGNIYVADTLNNAVRKITPNGVVTTLARGFAWSYGLTVDAANNVILVETDAQRLDKIAPDGTVTVFAYGGLNFPKNIVMDSKGNFFITDFWNHMIRKVTANGVITTFAGSGLNGYADGTATQAQFNYPYSIGIDEADNLYVGDVENFVIRKITPDAQVSTIAGVAGRQGDILGILPGGLDRVNSIAVSGKIISFADGASAILQLR